jgi:Alginate export
LTQVKASDAMQRPEFTPWLPDVHISSAAIREKIMNALVDDFPRRRRVRMTYDEQTGERKYMRLLGLIALAVSSMTLTGMAGAQEAVPFLEAISGGRPTLNLRPRHEYADQTGRVSGRATTLRTLAGWKTQSWKGFAGTIELIDVGRLNNDYNDNLNGKVQYPVIADPDNTDVNQLYVDYSGLPDTLIRTGRQSIKLDNVRFIGNVEFRQVMQVFNGITVENRSLPGTRIFMGYLARVKTVSTRQFETDTVLLNARLSFSPTDSLAVYGYFQDQPNAISPSAFASAAPGNTSNRISGLRLDGTRPLNEQWKFIYTGEVAKQHPYAGGNSRLDADYRRIGIGGQWRDNFLRVDQEILGSIDGEYAFQFPLATNHLFQGWADQFLVTPRQGIRDVFYTAGAKIEKLQLLGEYHHFNSDVGNIEFGREFDVSAAYALTPQLVGKIEYADYRAGDPASGKTDLTRVWVTLIFSY